MPPTASWPIEQSGMDCRLIISQSIWVLGIGGKQQQLLPTHSGGESICRQMARHRIRATSQGTSRVQSLMDSGSGSLGQLPQLIMISRRHRLPTPTTALDGGLEGRVGPQGEAVDVVGVGAHGLALHLGALGVRCAARFHGLHQQLVQAGGTDVRQELAQRGGVVAGLPGVLGPQGRFDHEAQQIGQSQ